MIRSSSAKVTRSLLLLAALGTQPALAADDPWAGPDQPVFDDPVNETPVFVPPHIRLGLHLQGGAVLGDSAGGFAGLELLVGTRLGRDFSLLARLNSDLGAWDAPSGALLTSGAWGLGGEYVLQEVAGRGTGLALGLTLGAWLRDACETPSCLRTLLPTATGHVALLFAGNHVATNPLSALSAGLSASAGYDPLAETMAGRIAIYFGYELSDR